MDYANIMWKGFQQIKPLTEFRIVCPHGLNHGQGES